MNFEFRVIVFSPIHKNDNSEFFMTRGDILGSKDSEFQVIVFYALYPKTITWNSSESTKAFNSENIVQVCLFFFKTHRVNNDFSNSVKDALSEFRVIRALFGVGQ